MYTQMKWEANGSELELVEDTSKAVKEYERKPYKIEITEVKDLNGDGAVDLTDIKLLLKSVNGKPKLLKGNGDFRSEECIKLLKEADIVVTNPPFSLFREYVSLLIEQKKKFVIIGNQNAITYKEIFPLLKDNKMWLGCKSGDMSFTVPDSYEARETRFWIDEKGQKWRSLGNACWFTNLDIDKRHENLVLYKKYTPEDYPHYDNYDAIEVGKVADIPCNYDGVMGVPITFMDKYNPEQFEVVGRDGDLDLSVTYDFFTPPNDECRDIYRKANKTWRIQNAYIVKGGKAQTVYKRLFIRKRKAGLD